jgi:hypothetical protein
LAPLLSPVLQPKLGGANLFSPPAGLGVTPIVSWQTQGRAPSFVRVTVYEVLPTGTRLAEKIHYIATASSQKITPGILETGKFYLLRLQSTWGQTHDPARPFLPSWPRSTVPVYSGIFTP